MTNRQKSLVAGVLAALILATLFFASPYITVWKLKNAMEARDSDGVSSHIDFPSVRESVKAQMVILVSEKMAKSKNAPSGALSTAMAGMMIGPLVDAFITPEGLAKIFAGEKPGAKMKKGPPHNESQSSTGREIERGMRYETFNRFVVDVKSQGDKGKPVQLIFERQGIWGWKLMSLRLNLSEGH